MMRHSRRGLLVYVLMAIAEIAQAESLTVIRQKAENGDARSQYMLGDYYFFGREGLIKNLPEALKWWRKSAEQGNAFAQSMIGVAYATGEGVPKDSVEAVKWYRAAADQGHTAAQYNLGCMYFSGAGVQMDFSETLKWWHKSAEGGFMRAQRDLGMLYTNGYPARGIERDLVQAYVWWSLAGAQGNEMAPKYVALLDKSMSADQATEAHQLVRERLAKLQK